MTWMIALGANNKYLGKGTGMNDLKISYENGKWWMMYSYEASWDCNYLLLNATFVLEKSFIFSENQWLIHRWFLMIGIKVAAKQGITINF